MAPSKRKIGPARPSDQHAKPDYQINWPAVISSAGLLVAISSAIALRVLLSSASSSTPAAISTSPQTDTEAVAIRQTLPASNEQTHVTGEEVVSEASSADAASHNSVKSSQESVAPDNTEEPPRLRLPAQLENYSSVSLDELAAMYGQPPILPSARRDREPVVTDPPPESPKSMTSPLAADLIRNVSQLSLDPEGYGSRERLLRAGIIEGRGYNFTTRSKGPRLGEEEFFKLLDERADLAGVPVVKGSACLTDETLAREKESITRAVQSRLIRAQAEVLRQQSRKRRSSGSADPGDTTSQLTQSKIDEIFLRDFQHLKDRFSSPAAATMFNQILQAESEAVRKELGSVDIHLQRITREAKQTKPK